ncbi:cyclin-dependent kinase 2 [Microdochium nivale]|nr:cyclin-dependent kinase 2 [Microdochium nivale]
MASHRPAIPRILIEDQPWESEKPTRTKVLPKDPRFPKRRQNTLTTQAKVLDNELLGAAILHRDNTTRFLHPELIPKILNEEAVTKLIKERQWCKTGTSGPLKYADFNPHRTESFLPTLAILIRIGYLDHFITFMEQGISKDTLPLRLEEDEGEVIIYQEGSSSTRAGEVELYCFDDQSIHWENFDAWQYRFMAPRLTINKTKEGHYEAKHEIYCAETVMPWIQPDSYNSQDGTRSFSDEGGFSQVTEVMMDERSHDFTEVLQGLGIASKSFAVKTLKKQNSQADPTKYENEVAQLKRFNAFKHPHLVMLLISYQLGDTYNFVFPFAKSNLKDYWSKNPVREPKEVLWLIEQLKGLVGATQVIHEPTFEPNMYGRHGDIKPENILIFEVHGKLKMVLSDMGLTALHSEYSRSQQSPAKTAMTPTYRPPESDFEGNVISRSYDIWTLGCLVMETLVWYLGGYHWLFQFSQERMTPDVTGCKKPTYFDIKRLDSKSPGAAAHTASIKQEVFEWFEKIRTHPRCTKFVLDIVDIVQDEMLIVRRKDKERITASKLLVKISNIYKQCQESDSCSRPVVCNPREVRVPVHVEVELGKHVLAQMNQTNITLRSYNGDTKMSVSREQLGKV